LAPKFQGPRFFDLRITGCNIVPSRILWKMLGIFQWVSLAVLKESMQSSKILEGL
jgi:hypothetical protein